MEIIALTERPDFEANSKFARKQDQLKHLLEELRSKKIPEHIVGQINRRIEELNFNTAKGKALEKHIGKVQSGILKILEEELQLVPKNHYRYKWLAIGMAAFGIPIGVLYGTTFDNYGFMGIGIPIGLALGVGIGNTKDKKAMEEGKQLEYERF